MTPLDLPPNRGTFVAFDGVDGSGKSTIVRLTARCLQLLGRKIATTKQPGGSAFGNEIRRILFETIGTANIEPDALEFLFLANHVHNCREIAAYLSEGTWVLADRHWPSAVAYMEQRNASRGLIELYEKYRSPEHDVLFLLVGDPAALLARARSRLDEMHQTAKKWNSVEAMTLVQQSFMSHFAHLANTVVVDVMEKTPATVVEKIVLPRLATSAADAMEVMDEIRSKHRDLLLWREP